MTTEEKKGSKKEYTILEETGQTDFVQETAFPFEKNGQNGYTLDDYYSIPDDRRAELIDGELFDMASPSVLHQQILVKLAVQFDRCVEKHRGKCRLFVAPCDVQLDRDNRTMVQPDLFILCREVDLNGRFIPGAPDLTLEILSGSTRSRDLFLKTYKYKNAGVREYWIVDPDKREILVYDFSDDSLTPQKYSFTDVVPVLISEGECSIDFRRIL